MNAKGAPVAVWSNGADSIKEPGIKYELTEFETLGKPIHEIITIYQKTVEAGRDAGKVKYFLKSFIPFSTGNEEVQVYVEGGKSAPEEIVRQLWVYKLVNQYGYKEEEIDLEKCVQFGTEVGTKAADIIVYFRFHGCCGLPENESYFHFPPRPAMEPKRTLSLVFPFFHLMPSPNAQEKQDLRTRIGHVLSFYF